MIDLDTMTVRPQVGVEFKTYPFTLVYANYQAQCLLRVTFGQDCETLAWDTSLGSTTPLSNYIPMQSTQTISINRSRKNVNCPMATIKLQNAPAFATFGDGVLTLSPTKPSDYGKFQIKIIWFNANLSNDASVTITRYVHCPQITD